MAQQRARDVESRLFAQIQERRAGGCEPPLERPHAEPELVGRGAHGVPMRRRRRPQMPPNRADGTVTVSFRGEYRIDPLAHHSVQQRIGTGRGPRQREVHIGRSPVRAAERAQDVVPDGNRSSDQLLDVLDARFEHGISERNGTSVVIERARAAAVGDVIEPLQNAKSGPDVRCALRHVADCAERRDARAFANEQAKVLA